jgi:hypothetical protein
MPKSRILTPVVCEHQVVGLHVAVNHPEPVRVGQPERRLARVVARLRDRQWAAVAEHVREAPPLHELHDEHRDRPDLLGIEGGDDVRVLEPRRGLHLLAEPFDRAGMFEQPRANHFERNRSLHEGVFGLVHRSHAAATEQLADPIAGMRGEFRRKCDGLRSRERAGGEGRRVGVGEVGGRVARAPGPAERDHERVGRQASVAGLCEAGGTSFVSLRPHRGRLQKPINTIAHQFRLLAPGGSANSLPLGPGVSSEPAAGAAVTCKDR